MIKLYRYITDSRRWSWQGAVALTAAVGIFLSSAIFYIGIAWHMAHGFVFGQPTITVMIATTMSLIGASATFLGRIPKQPNGKGRNDAGPPPAA